MSKQKLPNPLQGTQFVDKPIYQANPLIEACRGMDLLQGRLYYLALMALNPQLSDDSTDAKFCPILFNSADIIKLFGGYGGYHKNLKEKTKQLKGKVITIITGKDKNGDEKFRQIGIFDEFEWDPDKGGLRVEFSQKIKPYVFDLVNGKYTKIAGRTMFALQSPYATRLIELLLQYQNISEFKKTKKIKRNITVDKLRFYLGIADSSYTRMSNFKRNVLDAPIRDINAHTNYIMSYIAVKSGRNIVSFDFTLDISQADEQQPQTILEVVDIKNSAKLQELDASATVDNLEANIVDVLRRYGVGKIIAGRLAKEYSDEHIRKNIKYALSQKAVKNLGGYIPKAVREDYAGDKKQFEQMQLFEQKQVAEQKRAESKKVDAKIIANLEISSNQAELDELTYRSAKKVIETKDANRMRIYEKSLKRFGLTFDDIANHSFEELVNRVKKDVKEVQPELKTEISQAKNKDVTLFDIEVLPEDEAAAEEQLSKVAELKEKMKKIIPQLTEKEINLIRKEMENEGSIKGILKDILTEKLQKLNTDMYEVYYCLE